MGKNRLEAFSDGVIAIIITIMVLGIKIPLNAELQELIPLIPQIFCYLLSFVFIGIYWNNHHHMLYVTHKINGYALWANLHLLFWLSLIPFATGWMSENHFAMVPVALYGFILLMAAVAYYLLARILVWFHGEDSILNKALGKDYKGLSSIFIYIIAIALAFINPWIAVSLYIFVAVIWFFPDRRIERLIKFDAE